MANIKNKKDTIANTSNKSKEYEKQDNFGQEGNKLNKPGYRRDEHSRLQNEFNEKYIDEYNKVK